jgi:hypothetical protein
MASSSEPSRKRRREEVLPPLLAEVNAPPPEEVKSPSPDEPEEALVPQPVAVVRAPPLNADEATWSVNLFRDAFVKLRNVVVCFVVPVPSDPLQMTVKDYTFKINILVGDLERGVLAPVDDHGGDDGSLDGSGSGSSSGSESDSDGGAPPATTTSA